MLFFVSLHLLDVRQLPGLIGTLLRRFLRIRFSYSGLVDVGIAARTASLVFFNYHSLG